MDNLRSEEAGKDVKQGCKSPLSQLEDKKVHP